MPPTAIDKSVDQGDSGRVDTALQVIVIVMWNLQLKRVVEKKYEVA